MLLKNDEIHVETNESHFHFKSDRPIAICEYFLDLANRCRQPHQDYQHILGNYGEKKSVSCVV